MGTLKSIIGENFGNYSKYFGQNFKHNYLTQAYYCMVKLFLCVASLRVYYLQNLM